MKKHYLKWLTGIFFIAVTIFFLIVKQVPFLFYQELPYENFLGCSIYIILFGCLLSSFIIIKGPDALHRIIAMNLTGTLLIGLCAIFAISIKSGWYLDIAIAWGLQSFVSVLAVAKYMEGKGLDE